MHKGVILLVQADDRDEATDKAVEFLEGHQDSVFDWYALGGRWTGLLTGYNPETDPKNTETCTLCAGTGTRKDMKVENGCNGCAGKGEAVKWPTQWGAYDGDVSPLGAVLEKVKEYAGDTSAKIAAGRKSAAEAAAKGDRGMEGYYLGQVADLLREDFSFDANVYNVEEYGFGIPEDVAGWWAVVVDMHN